VKPIDGKLKSSDATSVDEISDSADTSDTTGDDETNATSDASASCETKESHSEAPIETVLITNKVMPECGIRKSISNNTRTFMYQRRRHV